MVHLSVAMAITTIVGLIVIIIATYRTRTNGHHDNCCHTTTAILMTSWVYLLAWLCVFGVYLAVVQLITQN